MMEDGGLLLDGIGRMLNAAGVPVSRLNIAAATLSTSHRGIGITARRGEGISILRTAHGTEGEAEYGRSPIEVLLAEDRRLGRWRIETGQGCEHLDALGQDVERYGGEVFKFTGDGFIAVFPVSDPEAMPCAVCSRALETARAGLAHNRALGIRRHDAGEPALAADLALHYGQAVYGNIGTANRLDFTAIGRAVNEASRIERSATRQAETS